MMRKLIVLGAGGHGKVVADTARASQRWSEIVFLDDRFPVIDQVSVWRVVGRFADFTHYIAESVDFIVAIGHNQTRLDWCQKIISSNGSLAIVIHPLSYISEAALIQPGTVCFAHSVVNIDAWLGLGCIVNSGAIIEHDCRIGDAVHICPNAALAGGVTIGNLSAIGIGSSVKQLVSIGASVVTGAGSVVISDIDNNCLMVGIPAKKMNK